MRERHVEGYPPVTTRLMRLYEVVLSRKLHARRSILTLLDQQLGQDLEEWEGELAGYIDRGEYSNVFFGSFFASSFALFEFELVQLCEFARRAIQFPFSVKDFGARDYMGNAKTYLQKLGVDVPVGSAEWARVTQYRTLRNKIMHEGGVLGENDNVIDFAAKNEILTEIPLLDGNRELDLRLSRDFCLQALDDMEAVLGKWGTAFQEWLEEKGL